MTLNKLDKPQIELIHEKARQRVDQYRRRMKLQARRARTIAKPDYSYDRENLHPLGLQLFLDKVRPTPMPMRDVAGAAPQPRLPHIVDPSPPNEPDKVLETERQMFSLREGANQNPYSWDFDLCTLTLGNFNYRKMTLVRDFSNLIETDLGSGAFDTIFLIEPPSRRGNAAAGIGIGRPAPRHFMRCDTGFGHLSRTHRCQLYYSRPARHRQITDHHQPHCRLCGARQTRVVCVRKARGH